jgi:hypothetical protein
MADFLPTADSDLLAFAQNFSTKITATPTAYGLIAGDATALAALVTTFSSALATALTPATRTAVTVASKDTARSVLVTELRSLAKRVQATPTVTAAQRTELGLPVHDAVPTPVPAPATTPLVNLMLVGSRTHTIRIVDETTPTKRARPAGAVGAEIFSFVGATPPADLEGWRYEGQATNSEFIVDYDAADVGKSATIVARWFNRKGQTGPVSNPITGTVAA